MKKFLLIATVVCVVGFCGFVAFAAFVTFVIFGGAFSGGPQYEQSLRYRATIVFATPEGMVTASSVQEWKMRLTDAFLNVHAGIGISTYGEVPHAILPGIGHVFATFGEGSGSLIPQACGIPSLVREKSLRAEWIDFVVDEFDRTCELPQKDWPTIVIFTDPGDRATASAYRPEALPAGIEIVSFLISPTDEPLTHDIETLLTWATPTGELRSTGAKDVRQIAGTEGKAITLSSYQFLRSKLQDEYSY